MTDPQHPRARNARDRNGRPSTSSRARRDPTMAGAQRFSWSGLPRTVRLAVTLIVGALVATVLAVGVGNAVSGSDAQTNAADGASPSAESLGTPSTVPTDRCSGLVPPTGAAASWADDALHLREAHQIADGAGVTVAVLDTGLNAVPDLSGVVSPNGISLIAGEDLADRSGHGTQMAQLVHLAAPAATILPIKVIGTTGGSRDVLAQGITLAVGRGADVITISLTGGNESPAVRSALQSATAAGTAVVVASGNEGLDLDRFPRYPASIDVAGVSVVTGAKSDGMLSRQSNWGAITVDVAAPGDDLTTTDATGRTIEAAGPSAATALTAGVAALLRAADPGLTPAAIADTLRTTSTPQSGLAGRTAGGLVNAVAALGCPTI